MFYQILVFIVVVAVDVILTSSDWGTSLQWLYYLTWELFLDCYKEVGFVIRPPLWVTLLWRIVTETKGSSLERYRVACRSRGLVHEEDKVQTGPCSTSVSEGLRTEDTRLLAVQLFGTCGIIGVSKSRLYTGAKSSEMPEAPRSPVTDVIRTRHITWSLAKPSSWRRLVCSVFSKNCFWLFAVHSLVSPCTVYQLGIKQVLSLDIVFYLDILYCHKSHIDVLVNDKAYRCTLYDVGLMTEIA